MARARAMARSKTPRHNGRDSDSSDSSDNSDDDAIQHSKQKRRGSVGSRSRQSHNSQRSGSRSSHNSGASSRNISKKNVSSSRNRAPSFSEDDSCESPINTVLRVTNQNVEKTTQGFGDARRNFQSSLDEFGLIMGKDGSLAPKNGPPAGPKTGGFAHNPAGIANDLPLAVQEMQATLMVRRGKPAKQDGTVLVIRKCVKGQLWRILKFIKGSKSREKAAYKVLDFLELEGFMGSTPEIVQHRLQWVTAYGPTVTKELNNQRSNVQSRIKDFFFSFAHRYGGNMPGVECIRLCLLRKLDMKRNGDYKMMKMYWTELIPLAAGNTKDWHADKRNYLTMMDAAPPNNANKLYVPPSTEAILMVMVESNHEKWKHLYAIRQEHKGKKMRAKTKIDPEKPETYEEDGKIILNDKKFLGKYTDSEKGQQEFSGWTPEGLAAFEKYRALNAEVRKQEATKTLENEFLKMLRAELKITALDPSEERLRKRRRMAHILEEEDENDDIFGGEE